MKNNYFNFAFLDYLLIKLLAVKIKNMKNFGTVLFKLF